MASRTKKQPLSYTLVDAVSNAFGEVESLAEEMRQWHDNMPESLQNGDRGQAICEAADALENINAVDVPEALDDSESPEHHVITVMPLPARKQSRSNRRDQAVQLLTEVKEHFEEKEGNDDAEQFAEELDNAISELEAVEFPGAYG